MSIVHDCIGFPVLMPAMYQYMVTRDIMYPVENEEIADLAVKHLVEMVGGQLCYNTVQYNPYLDTDCTR